MPGPQGVIRTRRIGWLLALMGAMLLCLSTGRASGDPWAPFLTPWFERVGTGDGLPHSVTTALAQDGRGLVWIGTMGGLARYDGFRMQVYDRAGGAGELPDTYVRALLALPDGDLLVGTNGGGLARFQARSRRFRNYPVGPGGTIDRKIYALAADGNGDGVWIATDRGLDRLALATDRITHVATGEEAATRNFSVLTDHAGNLWLGNERGLFMRAADSRGFTRVGAADPAVATVLGGQIWALHEDSAGRLWVGSGRSGAAYRADDGRWHAVPGYSPSAARNTFSTVRGFADNADGTTWIATDGEGVLAYRAGDAATRTMAHDPALPSSLPGDTVRALLFDATGNLWAATDLGAARTNTRAQAVCSLLPSPLHEAGLSDGNVRSILVDRRQRIWLGLGNGHLDVLDLSAGRMRHLALGGSQSHRDVQALAEGADGRIWAGTQGLAWVDPDTFAVTSDVVPALAGKPVLSLLAAGDALLVGTYEGVYRIDPALREPVHLRHDDADPGSLASDTVRGIARVGDDIWYATTGGISVAAGPQATGGFRQIRRGAGTPGGLPQDFVGGIATDDAGRVWIATFGGVATGEPGDGPLRLRTYDSRSGLSGNKVNTVLPDGDRHVWVSVSNGVSMIDSATGTVRNLGARDGLHIPGYIYLAAARAPDGSLLFGGLGGLTVVRGHARGEAAVAVPPPTVTSVHIDGHPLPPGELPRAGETLMLADGRRGLQVGFALLDYRAPTETRYAYRMEGFDEAWTELPVGSPPSAVYTNLPHGQYTLRLRAMTRGMFPATVESDVGISVPPRWYESAWLRALAALGVFALVGALVQLRTLYLRRQARRLQQLVDARTRELQDANVRLDQLAGTDELTGVYNRRRFLVMAEGVRALAGPGDAALAVLDLDRFKQINDRHGHLAGDAVIRAAAGIIASQCRPGDLVGRYGGEELVICLPDCEAAEAMRAAERIREAIAAAQVHVGGQAIQVTASIGVAVVAAGESMERWLSRADAALYEAKRQGRNRVVAAAPG